MVTCCTNPAAFDAYSNRLIEMRVPAEKRIAIDEPDAINFACNAVNIDHTRDYEQGQRWLEGPAGGGWL